MNISTNQRFVFDDFLLDTQNLSLYFRGELIRKTERKCLEVLAVLLENANQPASHELIINRVWKDDSFGKNSLNTAQCIRKLRKILTEFAPEKTYIETIKGTGYMFVGDVSENASDQDEIVFEEVIEDFFPSQTEAQTGRKQSAGSFFNPLYIGLGLIPLVMFLFLGWTWFAEDDKKEIERVVKESQLYESLVIYKKPSAFTETDLDKYWTSELSVNFNFDRQRIRQAVEKLKAEGKYYGNETKCETFDFQTIEINEQENFAIVKTLEKWFIAVYSGGGVLEKNKTVGPYFVSYFLRKVDGRWLIEKSNTARVNRPTPFLSELKLPSEIKANEKFLFEIKGRDFEPSTVFIEITGENCSAVNSCKISNPDLREKARLSELSIEEIPLILPSGEYRMLVRNGDSKPSDSLILKIP